KPPQPTLKTNENDSAVEMCRSVKMPLQKREMTGKMGARSTGFAVFLLVMACLSGVVWLKAQQGVVTGVGQDVTTVRITSPLGRTGLVTKVRIVAQVHVQTGASISAVSFFVDGMLVGTVETGPPYSVEWVD